MIAFEPVGTLAVLRFDRESKRNALTPRMLRDLLATLDTCGSARAIVLSGVGPIFCAGFDLAMCRDDESVLPELLAGLSRAIRVLRRDPRPVVVSAHGAAVAGGCALLGAADVVVTHAEAKLGYPVVSIGISPAVSAPTLSLMTDPGPARARLLEPALISGGRAAQIGLAHECVATREECEPRAIALAQELAQKPPRAFAETKRWLNTIDGSTRDETLDLALNTSLSLVGCDEQVQRLAALKL